jgi:glucan 1,3-beta-glucosidase
MPTDPRLSVGVCAALGVSGDPFAGTYDAWQTGGGDGSIAATAVAAFEWPPATIAGDGGGIANLPTYTPTGDIVTLPPPSLTATPTGVTVGDGWYDASDTAGAPTPIVGCTYPNAWDAQDVVPAPCAAGS